METSSRYKLRVEIPFLAYARWNDVFSLSSFISHLSSLIHCSRKKQRPRPKGAAVQQSKNHILQKEYFYLKAVLLLLKNLVPGNSATLAAYLIF